MKIHIWQYKPSMHQLSLIKGLEKVCEVTWIMQEKELAPERKEMGWQDGGLKPDFYLSTFKEMKDYIELLDNNAVHLFGGFNASKSLNKALKYCLKRNMITYVQSEAYQYAGLKGKLRTLLLRFEKQLFYDKVNGVFAMGELGVNFFVNHMGFSPQKVYPFAYYTEVLKKSRSREQKSLFNILFVGQLVPRKGIHILIDSCAQVKGNWELKIIGNGPMLEELKKKAETFDHGKISFLGNLPNEDVQNHMANSDLLVLPSLWDGWGAVVNEALMNGTPVIATSKCGSSTLLQDDWRGEIVKENSQFALQNAIQKRIVEGGITLKHREKIIKWSSCIKGEMGAKYIIEKIMGNDSALCIKEKA